VAAARLAEMATVSEPGPGVTRLPFTPEHRRAAARIAAWMGEAGLAVHMDGAGTLIGRCEGPGPEAPVLLMGSHQDSVRQGGAYDGMMGVLLPILALQALAAEGRSLPFAVECLAFADEEGVRFPTALLGPRALAGTLDPEVLDGVDSDGVSLAAAMADFGLDPAGLGGLARERAGLLGYVETHIEQGPALEAEAEALGVVTAISGIERHAIAVTGRAAHAGTTPMAWRRDALAAAAEIVTALEARARATEGLVATVGTLEVSPGAVNAIPGAVRLTAELRAAADATREAAGRWLADFCA